MCQGRSSLHKPSVLSWGTRDACNNSTVQEAALTRNHVPLQSRVRLYLWEHGKIWEDSLLLSPVPLSSQSRINSGPSPGKYWLPGWKTWETSSWQCSWAPTNTLFRAWVEFIASYFPIERTQVLLYLQPTSYNLILNSDCFHMQNLHFHMQNLHSKLDHKLTEGRGDHVFTSFESSAEPNTEWRSAVPVVKGQWPRGDLGGFSAHDPFNWE